MRAFLLCLPSILNLSKPRLSANRAPFARTFSLPETMERAAGFFLLALAAPVIATSAIAVARSVAPLAVHRAPASGTGRQAVLDAEASHHVARMDGAGANGRLGSSASSPIPRKTAKIPADPRVSSWFASFCRRHSIDELPQLWHVARGEMSLVGPRPLTRAEIDRYYAGDAAELLSVKPGLTGLWQIYGRSAIRFPRRAAWIWNWCEASRPELISRSWLAPFPPIIRGNGAW